jgi:Uma2 family endonuclease
MAQQCIETDQGGELTLAVAYLFPRQGEWTETDYFGLPETNRIVELSKGRLIIIPSQTNQHQKISGSLVFQFGNYLKLHNTGRFIIGPLNVRLYEETIRQPDIIFMSNEHKDRIGDTFWGVPDLVVEILSEGTAKVDKEDKYLEYQKAGVQEYWIVDPFKQNIIVYILETGVYKIFGKWDTGGIAKSKLLIGFEVSVDEIME